jgi:hypothetical protein
MKSKITLPGLIAGFILAIESLFCKAILDLSDIITFQIASGGNAGGNLCRSINFQYDWCSYQPGATVNSVIVQLKQLSRILSILE